MSIYDYKIQKLTDLKRLPEIGRLIHDTFIESGLISTKCKTTVDLYPHLNSRKETTILTAELNGKIIGTNSMTLDGPAGLHTDYYFKEETDFIRKTENTVLGSSWRIATSHEYRKKIRLFLDLIQKSFFIAKEKKIETCLFVFEKNHEEFYKKLLDAETIAQRNYNQYPYNNINFVLMKTDTQNSQKHLSKIFKRRKFDQNT